MKAAQIVQANEGRSVVVNEVEKPVVSEGKVLVEVHAAGVNPFDVKMKGMPIPQPATLGGDLSGVVIDVGPGVSGFNKGDEVYGQANIFNKGSGSFAQFDLASARSVALKPKSIGYIEAGAIPLTGVSALQALTEHINPTQGQKILIHGGAGGIGTVAIQIAKYLGAYVATTVSLKDFDYVKQLGADLVIDYKDQAFEDMLSDYDAIFDTVAGDTYRRSFKVLKKGGIIVSMLEKPDQVLMEQYGVRAVGQGTKVTTERLNKLAELIDQGIIKVHIDKVFPLEQASEALTYLEKGHPKGKVVLEVMKS